MQALEAIDIVGSGSDRLLDFRFSPRTSLKQRFFQWYANNPDCRSINFDRRERPLVDIHGHYCRCSAASLDQPFVDTAAYWLAKWRECGTFLPHAEAHFAQIQQPGGFGTWQTFREDWPRR